MLLELEPQSITTSRLISGDREGVELIRAGIERGAMGCEGDPVFLELLFVSGAALAAEAEAPQWWTQFLQDVVDPMVPGTANLVSSFTGNTMTRIEDIRSVLEARQASPALRLAATGALCHYHLKQDDAEALHIAAQ